MQPDLRYQGRRCNRGVPLHELSRIHRDQAK
jgi:hypothetical protein